MAEEQNDRTQPIRGAFPQKWLIFAAGVGTIGFALLALLGWLSGYHTLASFRANLIPMAPSTAVLSLLCGAVVAWRAWMPQSRSAFWFTLVAGSAVMLFAALLFVLGCLDIPREWEHFYSDTFAAIPGRAPAGHMSPIVACFFLLAGGSMLASLSRAKLPFWRVFLATGFAILLLTADFFLLLAYVYAASLLYSGKVIPPAAPSILIFFLLGMALLGLGRPPAEAPGAPREKQPPARWYFFPILVLLLTGIVIGGYLYYRQYEKQYCRMIENELASIADMKAEELAQFRKERLADGAMFFRNPPFSALVRRFLAHPEDTEAQQQLQIWLGKIQDCYPYSQIALLDAQQVPRLVVLPGIKPPSRTIAVAISNVLVSGQITIQDFYRHESDQQIYLGVLTPIFDESGAGRPLAVLALRMTPATYLYPFIQRWPMPSQTAETLLLRRDGSDALYLNDLRNQTNTALNLRIPLARTEVPAVRAVLGQTGKLQGVDYRGMPVMACARTIPGSPWVLLAKMDSAEVYAPLRERLWQMIILIFALLLGTGACAVVYWRREYLWFNQQQAATATALQASEVKFRNLFNNAEIGIFRSRLDGSEMLDINDKYLSILGRTRAEMIGRPTQPVWADPKTREEMIRALQAKRHVDNLECRLIRKDGRVITCSTSVRLYPEQGILEGTIIDITASRQAGEALQESERFLREVQDIASLGSYVLEIPGGQWRSSLVLDSVMGIGPAYERSVEGWTNLVHPDDRAMMGTYFREHVLGRHQPFAKEYRIIRHNDGAERWVYGRGRLEFDPQGRPVRMKGTIHDITERKQDEAKLHRQGALQLLLMNMAATYINLPAEVTYATIQASLQDLAEFVAADRAWISIFDFDREISRKIHEWCANGIEPHAAKLQAVPLSISPENLASYGRGEPVYLADVSSLPPGAWRAFLESQEVRSFLAIPLMVENKCEGLLGFNWVRRAYVYSGSETRLLGFFANMLSNVRLREQGEQEKARLQAQLLQAQKMESVGRLAGGVAHDFNNMIMAIMGYTELCQQAIEPDHPVHKWLHEIGKSAQRSVLLTRQLLAFARKQLISPKVLNLNTTISDMLHLLQRLIGEDIDVVWRPGENLWPVKVDPSQIDQVLTNLAANARDAIQGVGTITMETGNATLDPAFCAEHPGAVPGNYVMLSFSDTGCGMDPETRAHLFEPFFTTKGVGKGTGLGLATVYGIVKQNDGFIRVNSEPGQGTRFGVYWPALPDQNIRPEVKELPAKAIGGSETVLLVEDDESVRAVARSFLTSLGYTLLVAGSPEEALRLAAGHSGKIHLLLTDVIMPGMNGRDLSRRLLEVRPSLKCLFISGFTADVLAQRGILDDKLSFLPKPFSRAEFSRKVREVLDA